MPRSRPQSARITALELEAVLLGVLMMVALAQSAIAAATVVTSWF